MSDTVGDVVTRMMILANFCRNLAKMRMEEAIAYAYAAHNPTDESLAAWGVAQDRVAHLEAVVKANLPF